MTIPLTKRREQTRARLLDAAALVFAEVGLEGASVETISERAGFTRGAFYSNFDSKDELFLELAQQVGESRIDAVRARVAEFVSAGTLSNDADAGDLVRQIMDSGDDSRLSVLLIHEMKMRALRDQAFGQAYLAQESAMLASVAQIIQGIVDAGIFRPRVDVEVAAHMLTAQWEGKMLRAAIEGQDGKSLQESGSDGLADLIDLMFESC